MSANSMAMNWSSHQQQIAMERGEENGSSKEQEGTLLVLESKGTWVHAGYHLTTATAGPPLLSLPFAIAGLGWAWGLVALTAGALLSFYACLLLSRVMEHLEAHEGKRSIRYRDIAAHILGPKISSNFIGPLQFMVCFIAIIACNLLGGQTMKQVFLVLCKGEHFELYKFIFIFGTLTILLAQMPSLHSLRYFNLLSVVLCLGFCICAIAGSLYSGFHRHAFRSYSIVGTMTHKMFAIFNSISIMISAYANPLIVEIQATIIPPIEGKMVKGLGLCYSVTLITFFSVAISGYWAFGNASSGIIFNNMISQSKVVMVPQWLYVVGNAFACLQLVIIVVLYLQPTFEKLEGTLEDSRKGKFARRNMLPRLVGRSMFVIAATVLAAMLPFFAEFSAFLGSFGFTPICIIFPLLFYNKVFKGKHQILILCLNYTIIGGALIVVVMGSIASFRQILLNARKYHLFADL